MDHGVDPFRSADEVLAKDQVGETTGVVNAAMNVSERILRVGPIGVAAEQLIELVQLPSDKFANDVAVVLVSGEPVPQLGRAWS